jgi:hypothetical protein
MVIFHSFFLVGGFSPSPLKNDGVKVSWDEIPNILWKFMEHKIYVPSHQPFFLCLPEGKTTFCTDWRW